MELSDLPTVLLQICLEFGTLLSAVMVQEKRNRKRFQPDRNGFVDAH